MRRAALPPLAITLAIVTAIALLRFSAMVSNPVIAPVRGTAAIGPAAPAPDPAIAAAVRRFYDAANAVLRDGDPAALAPVLGPAFVDHAAQTARPATGGDLAQDLVVFRATYPGLRLAVDDLFAMGDRVTVRLHAEGANGATFLGLPIPGDPAVWGPIDVFRVSDGRVAERWGSRTRPGVVPRPLAEELVPVPSAMASDAATAPEARVRVSRLTVAAGATTGAPIAAGAVVSVETGRLVATAADHGESGPATGAVGTATVLDPEDELVVPTGAPTVLRNDGPRPAVALVVEVGAALVPDVAPAMPPQDGAGLTPQAPGVSTEILVAASLPAAAPTGGWTTAVGRLTLVAGASFPTGTVRGLVAVVVERGMLTVSRDGPWAAFGPGSGVVVFGGETALLRNTGPDALSLVVVTVGAR